MGEGRARVAVAVAALVALVLVALAAPAGAATVLRQGDRGEAVAAWQGQLNQVRDPDIATDGVFGPATDAATRGFQRDSGFPPADVDGVVGPQTRAAMDRALGGAAPPPGPAPAPASTTLRRGASGPAVRDLQEQLAAQRYWLGTPDGAFGDLTHQAVVAFQKVNGLARDGIVGPATRAALAQPAAPRPRTGGGDVLEVDKATQVLLWVRDGAVLHIWNTSTGTEQPYVYDGGTYLADTPVGEWTVGWQIDGWRTSNLGRLYRPKYFHPDGIAVHGYPEVPPYPASHGCVRVSMAAMDFLWPRVPIGMPVSVY